LQVTETPRGLGGFRQWALMKARGGAAFADEVCLTGQAFTAAQALQAGLISRVAEEGRAVAAAREIAEQIAACPPLSVRQTARIRRWHFMKLTREVAFQAEPARLDLTEDFAATVRAFTEKRPVGPFKAR
jgi:enoyl-CoA hydratase